ncbi:hypothetical protein FHT87_005884 [Rhizobium sp. BK316]|uniref:hypothetical protein n=1 Tax=Rhizobium sp. BK316 TaxID=2587053 RepID=UPI00161DC4AB|nr:hypothetical protein [Rhizobium sp. BK316]MBB3411917.1 hypothetical protein [Rhizobium sp. BK316]
MSRFLSPSEMMRSKRPYLYSDSEKIEVYRLTESELSHHLETLTDRNQHKDFENFCRKLCEREISPNLRPPTGPEGGGDGKIDTDTYPVTAPITERWFVGDGRSREEHWAFAFSTKKTWAAKIRSDVESISGTGRHYDRIICVTSRAARQRDRLALEEELKKSFGFPITIFDREWIIDRVFTHSHKDLAFQYLHAGSHAPNEIRIGPNDFRRQQALEVVENRLSKIGNAPDDLTQVVSDSFEAARLSRELERPRYETEGRFQRAINLAKKYGSTSQELRATYEDAWTQFWWFDDADAMQERYDAVEELAFPTDLSEHISNLCNLLQIMAGRIAQGLETDDQMSFTERAARLKSKLSELALDTKRPNNALHAKTLLIFMELSHCLAKGEADLDATWKELSQIIDKSAGLSEYPAEMLDTMVSAFSEFAPDSDAFDDLIEKLAEFMAERNKEVTAGDLYVQQGERKLKAEKPIDAIKWLGRAAVNYAKDESREKQAQALYYLSVAYQGASLLWAARATAFAALIQYFALSEREGELRVEAVPTLNLLASVSLRLGHLADFLDTIQFLRSFERVMPLDEESKKRLHDQLVEFDNLLACFIVSKADDEIARLTELPDILENLDLFTARFVLLYRLGYQDLLYTDGSVPPETPVEEVSGIMRAMAAQPATHSLPQQSVILDRDFCGVRTRVLGVQVEVRVGNSEDGFLAAETYAAALEGFAATLLNIRVFPHTEKLTINILDASSSDVPIVNVDDAKPIIEVATPKEWQLTDIAYVGQYNSHLMETMGIVLDHIAILPDSETVIDILTTERVFERATLFCRIGLSRQRTFGSAIGVFANLRHLVTRNYPPQTERPPVPIADQLPYDDGTQIVGERSVRDLDRHDDIVIRSIVDGRLWDAAKWRGMMFGHSPGLPPLVGLIFEDGGKAEAILQSWLDRFGPTDTDDLIRLSVIRGIDRHNPHHYRGHITHNIDPSKGDRLKPIINTSRMMTMTPENSTNLETFLSLYNMWGHYYLTAASVGSSGVPELRVDLAIVKNKFYVRDAWTVGEHDIDAMAIRPDDNVIIPANEIDPPVRRLQELRRNPRK